MELILPAVWRSLTSDAIFQKPVFQGRQRMDL